MTYQIQNELILIGIRQKMKETIENVYKYENGIYMQWRWKMLVGRRN